jgi:transposase InsO family protein
MSTSVSPSANKAYGILAVCRAWRISRATLYRQRQLQHPSQPGVAKRRGPQGPACDAELVAAIRQELAQSPFHGEGYRKVWARLRYKGVRTSKRRVLRLMREHGLLAPHRRGAVRGPRAHDGSIVTSRVDAMWGTDLTTTFTRAEGQVAVFVAVDHCSVECVGLHAAKRADRFEALEPVRQGVRERFGLMARDAAKGLKLRHDHGSQYMADHFHTEIEWLGVESSPAFVRAPEGNGCAERFIRTLKENLLWVKTFDSIEELRQALLDFKRRYNEQWLIERHGFRSPAQVRAAQLGPIAMAA